MQDRPIPVNVTELHWATLQEEAADDSHLADLVAINDTRIKAIEDRIAKGETVARVTLLEATVKSLEERLAELEKKPKK